MAVGTAIMDASKNKQVTVYDGIGTMAGGRKQSIDEVNNTLTKLQGSQANIRNYKDPLRELVLISETPTLKPDNTYVSNVTTLAKEATILEHVKEVHPEPAGGVVRSPSLAAPTKVEKSIVSTDVEKSSLSVMFQDPKDIVDPVKEQEFLRKLQELEESDSEGIGCEKPVLGKISLIRRAKSAVSRTTCEQKTNDKHPLFHVAWEQRDNVKQRPATTGAISSTKTSSVTVEIEPGVPDGGDAEDEEYVTVAEVKSHMEMFHLRKSIPPPETKLKEEKSGKYSRARRNKTSKYNKSVDMNTFHIFIHLFIYVW